MEEKEISSSPTKPLVVSPVFSDVLSEVSRLVVEKNALYADAWQEQGWRGNLARVLSKSGRLRHMLWRPNPVPDNKEAVEDTVLDMIALLAFMLINLRDCNEWGE